MFVRKEMCDLGLTFTGGQLVFQLVVPFSLGWQGRLDFLAVQTINAAFGLQEGEKDAKRRQNRWGEWTFTREDHLLLLLRIHVSH